MNQWIGKTAEAALLDIYRPDPWRRFALTGPLSAVTILAMLLGSRFLKPSLPPPPQHNAIEARIVEIEAPKPAGLQGAPATVTVKPKTAEKPHPKKVTQRPKSEPLPVITHSETSAVGGGPSVPTMPENAGKEEAVGIPGGTGEGAGAGLGNDASGARAIYAPPPTIPDDMRENVFSAVAVAHFKVAPDGTVEVTLTQPTPNPRLNQILLNTLKQWKFFPAMKDGIAINSEFDVRIPITVQ